MNSKTELIKELVKKMTDDNFLYYSKEEIDHVFSIFSKLSEMTNVNRGMLKMIVSSLTALQLFPMNDGNREDLKKEIKIYIKNI